MSTSTDPAAVTHTPHPRRWQALGLLGVAQLMLILDVTVVAIAIPQLGRDLEMGREALTWVMSAYTLAFGGLMLVGGRAADLFGARRQVLVGLTVFTGASLVAGLSTDASTILGARAAQGVGAAMLSPAALSLVVRLFDGEERNRALGIWSALGGVGAALGVLLGGVITAGPGWEWVFFVNVPIGLAVGVALLRVVPPMAVVGDRSRLDVVGAVLVTGATGVLIYAFINAGDVGWGAGETVGLLVAGVVLYGVLATWLRMARNPLVPPALATRRPVGAGTFVLFVATALMVAMFFLGTFFLQDVRGHGPLATGLMFLPLAAATMAGAHTGERLLGRLGGRTVAVTGLLVTAAGLLAASGADATAVKVTGASVASVGLGSLFVVASVTALSNVEPHQAGTASGLLSTFHELGAASGAAVMSGVVGSGLAADSLAAIERGYLVAAAVAAGAAVVAAVLIPGRPRGTAAGDDVPPETSGRAPEQRPVKAFVQHYAEMVVAMLVGMVTLYPLWEIATGSAPESSWANRVEVEMLVMATAMTVPMALWMVRRGHGRQPVVEMSAAMYAGFVLLFPLLWAGTLDDMGVMMYGHVLMPAFMLGAMLLRREEYAHAHRAREVVV
jgi:EmrB/QacA subfamily drug resistance transporter